MSRSIADLLAGLPDNSGVTPLPGEAQWFTLMEAMLRLRERDQAVYDARRNELSQRWHVLDTPAWLRLHLRFMALLTREMAATVSDEEVKQQCIEASKVLEAGARVDVPDEMVVAYHGTLIPLFVRVKAEHQATADEDERLAGASVPLDAFGAATPAWVWDHPSAAKKDPAVSAFEIFMGSNRIATAVLDAIEGEITAAEARP